MKVGAICSREVIVIGGHEPVVAAAQLMREHHVGDLVVVEQGEQGTIPIGILTDRDIVVGAVAQAATEVPRLMIADVATDELVTARASEELGDVIKRMRDSAVRRVPIVDDEGHLVGILALDDILDFLAEELSDIAKLVGCQQRREREARP